MKLTGALIIISIIGLSSCYYDKEELLYPGQSVCDTTLITYSQTVVPIISSNCLGCHAGANASASIRLDNYTGVKNVASNGLLLGAINHAAGFSPMPKNGNKLSDCNITKIRLWVEAGTPNN